MDQYEWTKTVCEHLGAGLMVAALLDRTRDMCSTCKNTGLPLSPSGTGEEGVSVRRDPGNSPEARERPEWLKWSGGEGADGFAAQLRLVVVEILGSKACTMSPSVSSRILIVSQPEDDPVFRGEELGNLGGV